MINTIAPVWDGNETWLVLGGGAVFAAFPIAYAILLPALYAPITIMLLGLVFRGVAFEFRFRSARRGRLWDVSFVGGSVAASFMQGVALGAVLQQKQDDGTLRPVAFWSYKLKAAERNYSATELELMALVVTVLLLGG